MRSMRSYEFNSFNDYKLANFMFDVDCLLMCVVKCLKYLEMLCLWCLEGS